jgi:hypothetical protein
MPLRRVGAPSHVVRLNQASRPCERRTPSASLAGFGKQISLGVFGTDFGSDVMTISLQLSKSERRCRTLLLLAV